MRTQRPGHTLVALVVALLVVIAVVPGTAAARTQVGVSVVVERGETVGDVTAAAGSVLVLGTVEGDVTALAGNVVVNGEVTGDVTAVGGNVDVTGEVRGTVRGFAVNAGLDGSVDGGVEMIVGFLAVGGRVGGPVDATGVFVEVERGGRVEGGMLTTAYQTSVNGTVLGGPGGAGGGNATSAASANATGISRGTAASTALAPETTAGRPAVAPPPAALVSRVAGPAVDDPAPQLVPVGGRRSGFGIFALYGFLVNLLFGALLVGFLPNFSSRVSSLITGEPVRSAVAGVAVSIVTPLVLLVLALSLFGLPIALAGGAAYVLAGWVGAAYGRFAVGTWLLAGVARALTYVDVETEPVRNRWARLFVGYLAVLILLRVPYLGTVVDTVVLALGLGAITVVGFDAYARSEREPPPAGAPDLEGDAS